MAITDKIKIDFQFFSTGDPKLLVISDTSVWSYIEEKPAIIEIVSPNSYAAVVYNFVKGKNNIFNSSNLMLSPVAVYKDLPDGLYKVTVKGSPDSFCKTRDILKTDQTTLALYQLYLSLGFDEKNKDVLKIIRENKLLIEASEASVSLGETLKGLNYLKTAMKNLKKYNECKECK